MYELCSINNTTGDDRNTQQIPFLNASSDPLNAWITKYNANAEQTNKLFTSLNAEQEQEQEVIQHIGVGGYNLVTKAWDDEEINPETNTEESYSGAGSWDVIHKCWLN